MYYTKIFLYFQTQNLFGHFQEITILLLISVLDVHQLNGASSYHSGLDIAAPQNTNIYSVLSGKVTFTGFSGAGGFTITITSNNFSISYCHVSPNFIIQVRRNY